MTRRTRSLGLTVLGVYLVLQGLAQLVHLYFTGYTVLLGLSALLAGVLILAGR